MKIRKILAAFVSVVTICSVISVPTFAAQETQIVTDLVSPAYEYAMSTKSYLTITSSTAECKSVCDGMAGVTQITVENEVDGASWTKTVYSDTIRLSNTKSGLDSGTYRLKSVFTLKSSSGDTEKITVYSDEKTVG